MRFVDISVKLLQYTVVVPVTKNSTEQLTAFYYDANLKYFGRPHAAYGVLAIVCLLVFVVPPVTVLLFYHLKIFQRCLSWCKLDRPGLHALVDAYQGCFKNSATDGVERRYFAGIYFLFRLSIILMIFFSSFSKFNAFRLLMAEFSLSLLMAGVLSVLRPYKRIGHNVIDFVLFLFMASLSATHLIHILINQEPISLTILVPLPAFLLICYLTYRLFKWLCCTVRASSSRRHQPIEEVELADKQQPLLPPTRSEVSLADYTPDDLFADRMLNPNGYKIND